jgi:hypothetical protein
VQIRDIAKKLTQVVKIMCYITHENGLKLVFSRKRTCEPFWPGDLPLVVLCIKLWSVRGGGTSRVTNCIILASVWEVNPSCQGT